VLVLGRPAGALNRNHRRSVATAPPHCRTLHLWDRPLDLIFATGSGWHPR
jgi:hypothetical protein